MPLVRIAMRRGKSPAYRSAILDGVHRALHETFEVPEDDRFAIITEHEPEDFGFDRGYLGVTRSDDLVMIHLTVSATRGVHQKKALYAATARNLVGAPGLRPEDVFIALVENRREDWSFGNGAAQYVA